METDSYNSESVISPMNSPMHRAECLAVVDEIIDGMDDRGILELMQGTGGDLDKVLDNLLKDTYQVLYTGNPNIDFAPKYTDRLSQSIEEILRCKNLTYFITSVLPDFQLSWHHIEWGDLVMRYKKLCIEAARDHGKSIVSGSFIVGYDGKLKKVDDVRVGDLLMGVDSTPRRVTAVYHGHDKHMYRIDQSKGDSYTVNSRHICTLIQVERKDGCLENWKKSIVDIDIPTLLTYSEDCIKERFRGFKVDWEKSESDRKKLKDWGTIDGITPSVVSSIKITDVGEGDYVSITTDGDHRFLLGDGTVTHNSYYFSNAYAAWQLYKYAKPKGSIFSARPTKTNSNRGYLFSFSLQQSVDLMEILKGTIESNDILKERLFPDSKNTGVWASTNIVCRNGARLTCKGFGSSVRGAHPYWIVVDDGLKDNVIYSQLQRQKSIDYFHSVIMNMLVPGGQIVVVGTPFHASDLYGDLKSKSIFVNGRRNGWFVIEYPAIFPDGRILWPQRWSFFDLMDKRATQGNIIFSRENLCRPITNESSIFPLKVLERSLVRMENYVLVRNRDDFPIKFNKVVVGCDFAISANVGTDYTVFTVWGVEDETGERWLLHFYRDRGKTFHEQMQVLKGINVRFRPDTMILEQNTFQQIFVQESDKQGLPVIGHTTGIDKYDLKTGWPGLAIDFERGKIHIPIGDKYSQDVKDLIFSDLGSVAFTDKGLESVGEHDDISSSFWLAKLGANLITTGFKYTFLG